MSEKNKPTVTKWFLEQARAYKETATKYLATYRAAPPGTTVNENLRAYEAAVNLSEEALALSFQNKDEADQMRELRKNDPDYDRW